MTYDKYDFDKMAESVSEEYINNGTPLKVTITTISTNKALNPEQIKRLSEAANIKTYNKMYDKEDDKTFSFDVADSKEIIEDVYKEDQSVEVKDMPPVQYEPEKNPKNPQDNAEIINDTDELEVSLNTANSEDAAGDDYGDSLKIPKKDYSYSTLEDELDSAEGDEEDESTETMDDEEQKQKILSKVSSEQVSEVKRELDNREMLLSEQIVDDVNALSSNFMGHDKYEKFASFLGDYCAMRELGEDHKDAITMVSDAANIDSRRVEIPRVKFASTETELHRKLDELSSKVKEAMKINKIKDILL